MSVYKKKQWQQACDENLTDAELKAQWTALSPTLKQPYNAIAEQQLQRGPFLVEEITNNLMMTRGSITWRQLEAQLRMHRTLH